jgi:tetratricopeptide (TPR) repeat protein
MKRRRMKLLIVVLAVAGGVTYAAPSIAARYFRYRGETELAAYRNQAASDWLTRAVTRTPNDAAILFLLARCNRRLGRFDEMERYLQRAARQGFPVRRLERERRLSIAQTGRVHEVASYLPDMLIAPENDGAEICASYATGYCLSLDFAAAGELLEVWRKDFEQDPEPHFRAGDLWYSKSEWAKAVDSYRRCLALDPSHRKARLSLAQCLLRQNEPSQAEAHFRQFLKSAPDNLEAQTGLATCLMTLGRLDEARERFREVAARAPDPQRSEARRRLGELELSSGRPKEALEWVRPLAEKWPEDKILCSVMAQALQQTGRSAEARPYWDAVRRAEESLALLEKLVNAVDDDPTNVELRYQIGTLVMRFRSRQDGAAWLMSLLQYDPNHAGAHRTLADYYTQLGDAELAETHRRAAESASQVLGDH